MKDHQGRFPLRQKEEDPLHHPKKMSQIFPQDVEGNTMILILVEMQLLLKYQEETKIF